MKKPISIKLDEKLWVYVKDKPNRSMYIQGLIKQDLQAQQTKPIVQAVLNQLLQSELFFEEIRARLGNSITNSITLPSKNENTPFIPGPPDAKTGYPCCLKQSPCKHWLWNDTDAVWVNELTGNSREG